VWRPPYEILWIFTIITLGKKTRFLPWDIGFQIIFKA